MKKRKNTPSQAAVERINKMSHEFGKIWEPDNEEINSDVLGSYTGNPVDTERPVQDADDL